MTKISIFGRVVLSGDVADESFSAMHDPRSKVMAQVKREEAAQPHLRCDVGPKR
jgi:asparagine synthetase B (glutamine-hydrolysing)